MPLPENLDTTDLAILRAIAAQPEISSRELEGRVFLSRPRIISRCRQLAAQNLIVISDGSPGQPFYYSLNPQVTPEEIEQYNQQRLDLNRDPVAREALAALVEGIEGISSQITQANGQLIRLLRQVENILM